jgi:hypothetical protein
LRIYSNALEGSGVIGYMLRIFSLAKPRSIVEVRESNPNLTERHIDDLYILKVRDYESMNLPPLMDKAHLFDAPSKSFMEDFKKKWEILRDIKM